MWDGIEPGQLAVAGEQAMFSGRKYRKAKAGGHQGNTPDSYPADEEGRTLAQWNTMLSNARAQIRCGIKADTKAGTKAGLAMAKRGRLMLEGIDTADGECAVDGVDGDGTMDMMFNGFGQWRSVRVSGGGGVAGGE